MENFLNIRKMPIIFALSLIGLLPFNSNALLKVNMNGYWVVKLTMVCSNGSSYPMQAAFGSEAAADQWIASRQLIAGNNNCQVRSIGKRYDGSSSQQAALAQNRQVAPSNIGPNIQAAAALRNCIDVQVACENGGTVSIDDDGDAEVWCEGVQGPPERCEIKGSGKVSNERYRGTVMKFSRPASVR